MGAVWVFNPFGPVMSKNKNPVGASASSVPRSLTVKDCGSVVEGIVIDEGVALRLSASVTSTVTSVPAGNALPLISPNVTVISIVSPAARFTDGGWPANRFSSR